MMISMQMRDLNFFIFMVYTVNAIFGVLFLKFSEDDELNGNCANTDFVVWGKVTGISCLAFSGLAFLFMMLIPCDKYFFSKFLLNLFYACLINSLICVFGLNYSMDDSCGYLSTLSSVYLISSMILYAILVLILFIVLCLFTSFNVVMNPNNTLNLNNGEQVPLLQQQQQDQLQQDPQFQGEEQNINNNLDGINNNAIIPENQQNNNNNHIEGQSYDSMDMESDDVEVEEQQLLQNEEGNEAHHLHQS